MLIYTLGDTTEQDLYLTLFENQTTSEPVYVFSFVNVLTKTEVSFIKYTTDDKSFWPERYNLFRIKPGELFTEPGEWHYKVIEQQSNTVLEQGMMIISSNTTFTFTKYNADNRYKAYRG